MTPWGRGIFKHAGLAATLFIALFLVFNTAYSKTVVKKTGECTREVTVNLELHSGGPRWTDAELAGLTPDQKKRIKNLMDGYSSYSEAELTKIGKEWGAEIESLWNGPTWDQLQGAKKDLGITDAELDKAVMDDVAGRAAIVKKLNDYLKKFGGGDASCAEINCCKIYFKVNIKVRKYTDKADPDYDQIKVMKKGWRSSVTTHDEGLDHNQEGTSGKWGYDPDKRRDASAGHETGHLMGLDDQYTDAGGTKEGHKYDIMDWSYGFPQEDALRQILKLGGAECDCCPRPDDGYYTAFGRTFLVSSDAIMTLNCPILKQTLADLQDQLSNVTQSRASITARSTLTSRLNDQIKRVKEALKKCDDEEDDAIFIPGGAPFTFDSNVCQFYGGGTIDLPVTPWGPYIPFVPETPGTAPPTGPGTIPPTGPITPVTPGGAPGPELVTPIPTDTIIKRETPPSEPGGTPTVPQEIIEMGFTGTPPIIIPIPEDDDKTTPPTPVFIVKAEQTVIEGGQTTTQPVEGAVLKLGYPVPDLPLTENPRTADATNDQHDQEPRHVVTDQDGIGMIFADGFESGDTSAWSSTAGAPEGRPVTGVQIDMTPTKSSIVYLADPEATGGDTLTVSNIGSSGEDGALQEALPESVEPFVTDKIKFGDTWGITLSYNYNLEDDILVDLEGYQVEENHYRDKQKDDPYYNSKGSWGQSYPDQWAIQHVGFVEGRKGAWRAAGKDLAPVIVAVIDTGLDWNHADISWDNIWRNEDEIPANGIDDDLNGYIDDVIGWDFYANTPRPWDQDGHGTFTTGMIAATSDNGIGIAGINPAAKIMVLKALNDFGHTRASFLAKAIKYAADNGARVINLSVGGKHLTRLEKMAVEYAHAKGVVIVVAAGNNGSPVSDYGLSPYQEVITVASTDMEDKRAFFSNLGAEIDVAAPGLDVLSLRARRTDFMRHIRNVEYEEQSAYVGEDKRYYRSSGTSFSAPIVSGLASLILSMNPDLSNVEVKRMILNSARDIETPGRDQYTGLGVVDAVAALKADPAFEIVADIAGISVVSEAGQTFVAVTGTASANEFDYAEISIGQGESPSSFKTVGERVMTPVFGGTLALIPAGEFRTAPVWTVRVIVIHKNGQKREEWFTLSLG